MKRVAIIGASMTQFGQRDAWVRELLAEAGAAALDDAGIDGDDLDHLYVSNMASGEFEGQTGVPNALAHDLAATPAYTARIDQTSSSSRCGRVRRVAVDRLWHERSDDARRRREDDPPDDRRRPT